jgi:hypothetical protein
VSLTTWAVARHDVVLIEGDSTADPAFPYQGVAPLLIEARGHYAGDGGKLEADLPTFVNRATSGAQFSDIAARIAAEVASDHATKIAIMAGVNNAANNVPLLTSIADATTILDATAGTGRDTILLGPFNWSGSGAEARIVALNAALATLCASYAHALFLDLRTLLAATATYSPGLTNADVYCPYEGTHVHWGPLGRNAIRRLVVPYMSFSTPIVP